MSNLMISFLLKDAYMLKEAKGIKTLYKRKLAETRRERQGKEPLIRNARTARKSKDTAIAEQERLLKEFTKATERSKALQLQVMNEADPVRKAALRTQLKLVGKQVNDLEAALNKSNKAVIDRANQATRAGRVVQENAANYGGPGSGATTADRLKAAAKTIINAPGQLIKKKPLTPQQKKWIKAKEDQDIALRLENRAEWKRFFSPTNMAEKSFVTPLKYAYKHPLYTAGLIGAPVAGIAANTDEGQKYLTDLFLNNKDYLASVGQWNPQAGSKTNAPPYEKRVTENPSVFNGEQTGTSVNLPAPTKEEQAAAKKQHDVKVQAKKDAEQTRLTAEADEKKKQAYLNSPEYKAKLAHEKNMQDLLWYGGGMATGASLGAAIDTKNRLRGALIGAPTALLATYGLRKWLDHVNQA